MSRTVAKPTIGNQGGTVGRPRIEPPADAAAVIEQMAAEGHPVPLIARRLGVSERTFYEWLREREDLRDARKAGKATEEQHLVAGMRQIADQRGDLSAAVKAGSFLLATRHGYRDRDVPQGEPSNVRITLEIPAALTLEQFAQVRGKVIDHE